MYKVKVNGTNSFEITKKAISTLDAVETSKNKFHILENNSSVKAEILKSNFNNKTYTIKVNNNTYEIIINDGLDQQIENLGFQIGASKQINTIKAPMPGLILEINVEVGQEVKQNDALLILEAMKMENIITSPREGIIKSVNVKQGGTVEKNTLLIEFE